MGFSNGDIKALVTKSKIAGFGMNWQNCHNVIFCGLSDSYEQFYQAVRRCWRFGQIRQVNVYVIIGVRETAVLNNIQRKQREANQMQREMIKYTKNIMKDSIKATSRETAGYNPKIEMILPDWLGGIAN